MTGYERLAMYERNLQALLKRKEELKMQMAQLQDELEMLEDSIWDAKVEIEECEADFLNPEYPE